MNTNINLVINLAGQDWQMQQLEMRLFKDENAEVEIVNLEPDDLKKDPDERMQQLLSKVNSSSRIYIVDHGTPNSSSIASAHYSELAEYLAKGLNEEKINNQRTKLRISLISCNSAVGNEKSFAGLFHRYLGQIKHLDVDVLSRTKVVAISREASEVGKTTSSLLDYAVKKGIYELGCPSLYKLLEEDINTKHQVPGSKVTFKWDKEGKEYIIDSYIDKYARETIKSLKKNLKNIDSNHSLVELITPETSRIFRLCLQEKELNLDKINEITSCLKSIKNKLKKQKDFDLGEFVKEIEGLINFKKTSINGDSFEIAELNYEITGDGEDIKNINEYIKKEVYKPIVDLLKNIPSENKKLKEEAKKLLQMIGDNISTRMKLNQPIEREMALAEYIKSSLSLAISKSFSEEEKYLHFNILKEKIESFIKDEIVISEHLKGAFEGLKHALSYGGLTTLQMLLPAIKGFSESEAKIIEEYFKQIHQFKLQLDIYTSEVENASVDQSIKEAENIANIATTPINDALASTYKIITDNRRDKREIKRIIKNNYAINQFVESRLIKLKRSLNFTENKKLNSIIEFYSIRPIEERLNSLKLATEQLEDSLDVEGMAKGAG